MSMDGRPSAQRRHTRASEAKRDAQNDLGVSVRVDGVNYVVREGEMNALHTMALRRETGYSFAELMLALTKSPDIDLVAAIVWLSRRQDGEVALPFVAVASEISYDSKVELVEEAGPETVPQP